MTAPSLDDGIRRALTFQSYPKPPSIEGVFLKPLQKNRSLEGSFTEILRLLEGAAQDLPIAFPLRQLSFSQASPQRMNAFHIHPNAPQEELWTVLEGDLLVWLVDCRQGSPTRGNRRSFLLSGEDPSLLFIPSGIAHGYRAGSLGALLLYAATQTFDAENPNEGRIPWDHFGKELWEDNRG